jgi:hypothetical protein
MWFNFRSSDACFLVMTGIVDDHETIAAYRHVLDGSAVTVCRLRVKAQELLLKGPVVKGLSALFGRQGVFGRLLIPIWGHPGANARKRGRLTGPLMDGQVLAR